jgi:hypothetical protein
MTPMAPTGTLWPHLLRVNEYLYQHDDSDINHDTISPYSAGERLPGIAVYLAVTSRSSCDRYGIARHIGIAVLIIGDGRASVVPVR